MRRVGLALTAILIASTATSGAIACSCIRYASALEQYDKTDLLFVGRVIAIEARRGEGGLPDVLTTFAVSRTIKGPSEARRTVVHSTPAGGNCGIPLLKGRTYFVGALMGNDGKLYTGSCMKPQFPVEAFERIARAN